MVGNYPVKSWISVKWWTITLYNPTIITVKKLDFCQMAGNYTYESWISVKWCAIIRMKVGFLSNGEQLYV